MAGRVLSVIVAVMVYARHDVRETALAIRNQTLDQSRPKRRQPDTEARRIPDQVGARGGRHQDRIRVSTLPWTSVKRTSRPA